MYFLFLAIIIIVLTKVYWTNNKYPFSLMDAFNKHKVFFKNTINEKHGYKILNEIHHVFKKHKILIKDKLKKNFYDAIIIAVPHKAIKKLSINHLKSLGNKKLIIIDLKSIYPKKFVQWQL